MKLESLARGLVWAILGLPLAPASAFAAPPEDVAEPPADAFEPVEITPVELVPVFPPIEAVPPPPEPPVEPDPASEPPPPEPELEPEPAASVHAENVPHLRNPKIPPTGNTQMWFRSTSFFEYFGDNYNGYFDPTTGTTKGQTNDDRFFALVNYVNFGSDSRLKKGWKLSVSARVDTHNVFNAKAEPLCNTDGSEPVDGQYEITASESRECTFANDYRLERLQFFAANKYVEITAGDFNVNFGRGMGLSVRKIADIGVDATIKGARVDINTKYLSLTAIGGVANRQQTDFATRKLFYDPGYPHALCDNTPYLTGNKFGNPFMSMCTDIISGARAEAKLPGKVKLGTHYVFMWFGQRTTVADQYDGLHVVGGDISRKQIAKVWDVFAGVTGLLRNPHHKQYYPSLVEQGLGAYLSNGLTLGNTFVLIEGKYFDNYVVAKDPSATTIQYVELPTLERADQIIPAASNVAGGRVLVEYTLPKSRVVVYGNYLGYAFALKNADDMFDRQIGEMAHHAYAGMRWRHPVKGNEVQASAGYRWEGFTSERPITPQTPEGKPYVRRLPFFDVYLNQVVGHTRGMSHSLSLRVEWRYEEQQKGLRPKYFHRGNVIVGYALSPFLNVAFIGGYSSEFAPLLDEPKLHDQACDSPTECLRKPHLWPGAEIRINFLEASFLRIFAGRQVGGLLCVNGSCRQLPDFEGLRMDLILSF
jgi:hypothetical protein